MSHYQRVLGDDDVFRMINGEDLAAGKLNLDGFKRSRIQQALQKAGE